MTKFMNKIILNLPLKLSSNIQLIDSDLWIKGNMARCFNFVNRKTYENND